MARKKKGSGTSARPTEMQHQELALVQQSPENTNEEDISVQDVADEELTSKTWESQ